MTPESDGDLNSAIRDALSTGKTVTWRSSTADASGYVTVSAAQDYGSRICRSYRYTVRRGSDGGAPKDGTACQLNGSLDWSIHSQ